MTTSDTKSLQSVLGQFVAMVRERYVVEFPRPSNSTAGTHDMQVKVGSASYFIRPAGVSLPLPDPTLAADPTTVQSDPALAPEQGTRKRTPSHNEAQERI